MKSQEREWRAFSSLSAFLTRVAEDVDPYKNFELPPAKNVGVSGEKTSALEMAPPPTYCTNFTIVSRRNGFDVISSSFPAGDVGWFLPSGVEGVDDEKTTK